MHIPFKENKVMPFRKLLPQGIGAFIPSGHDDPETAG